MEILRRLKQFYRPYWLLGTVSLIAVLMATAVRLVSPELLRRLVDRVVVQGDYGTLPYLALGVIGVAVWRGLFQYIRAYAGHVFAANTVYDLRNALYQRLQSFSFSYYDRAQTGDLMSRLAGDVEVLRQFFAFSLANLLDFIFLFFLGLAMMLVLDWQLTLICLAAMPLLAVLVVRFHALAHPAFTRLREAMAEMATAVQENITGVRTVKSFAREPQQIGFFGRKVQDYVDRHMWAAGLWARYFPQMELLGNVAILVLLWYGGRQVARGEITIGELVAFFSLIWFIINPIQQLGYQINNFTQSVAAGERLLEILDTHQSIKAPENPVRPAELLGHVRFETVSFAYPGGPPSLAAIHLDAPPGSVIGLLGPTGSGKSTLVSLIPRYYDVTAGRVTIDGYDVRELALDELRHQVAIVFQETFLFSTTIRENISFGRRTASFDEIVAAAKLAQAHDFILEAPNGYDTVVGERGLGLSGGQKQRIAIARALLANPRVLILDDATASVDMETEYLIQKALKALMQNRTTFIIAHRISSIRSAHEILVLDGGRVVERGRHDQLLARDGIYRRIYDVQFQDYDPPSAGTAAAPAPGAAPGGHSAATSRKGSA